MHERTRISKSLNTIVTRLDNICSITQSILENNGGLSEYLKATLGEQQSTETWMTQKEVAYALQVTRQTVRNWRVSGKLVPKQVGGRMQYAKSEVIRLGNDLCLLK